MNFPLETCSFITGIKPSLSKALIESLKAPTPGSISESACFISFISLEILVSIPAFLKPLDIHATKPPLKMLSH